MVSDEIVGCPNLVDNLRYGSACVYAGDNGEFVPDAPEGYGDSAVSDYLVDEIADHAAYATSYRSDCGVVGRCSDVVHVALSLPRVCAPL